MPSHRAQNEDGKWELRSIDESHHPASKCFARISVLLAMGSAAAKEVAKHGDLPLEQVIELGSSGGESFAHMSSCRPLPRRRCKFSVPSMAPLG